jgi:hypothetical protein
MSKEFLVVTGLAFSAYYIGIVIRKYTIPGTNSLPLLKQFLLGIPASLIVVSPLLSFLNIALSQADSNPQSVFVALGLILEHGMLVNETITKKLDELKTRI